MTAITSCYSRKSSKPGMAGISSIPRAAVCCRRFDRVLRERPAHVLADQWRRMFGAATERRDQCGRAGGIAERDRDVAQPSLVPYAADGAAGGFLEKFALAPIKKLDETGMIEPM